MSSALALISTLASISSSPITLLSMIPLIAVGLNYYRYTNVDPESAPIDAPVVSLLLSRFYCITFSIIKTFSTFLHSVSVKETL